MSKAIDPVANEKITRLLKELISAKEMIADFESANEDVIETYRELAKVHNSAWHAAKSAINEATTDAPLDFSELLPGVKSQIRVSEKVRVEEIPVKLMMTPGLVTGVSKDVVKELIRDGKIDAGTARRIFVVESQVAVFMAGLKTIDV